MIDFNEILKLYDNIICIIETGSGLFVGNNNDRDYIVIIDRNDEYFKNIKIDNTDYFVRSLKTAENIININTKQSAYSLSFEYGKTDVAYGEFPFADYDWFNHRQKVIGFSIEYIIRKYFSSTKVYNGKNADACPKHDYWIFANYFALVNNSLDFTPEQLDIIQKCHDNELPRSYAEDLYQKFIELQQEL